MDPNHILIRIKMLEAGIVPFIGGPNQKDEIKRGLESLDPKEQRKAKRKYRKLWRKAAKARGCFRYPEWDPTSFFAPPLSSPEAEPSPKQRARRRVLVRSEFVVALNE